MFLSVYVTDWWVLLYLLCLLQYEFSSPRRVEIGPQLPGLGVWVKTGEGNKVCLEQWRARVPSTLTAVSSRPGTLFWVSELRLQRCAWVPANSWRSYHSQSGQVLLWVVFWTRSFCALHAGSPQRVCQGRTQCLVWCALTATSQVRKFSLQRFWVRSSLNTHESVGRIWILGPKLL